MTAFDVALTLHADHELNASTFAARVAAATLTDIYSAVVAAIGTLKGPLHGGANAEVMKMLLDRRNRQRPAHRRLVKGKFARGEKMTGFGHRVYKTEDPRATHLRQMSARPRQSRRPSSLVGHVAAHRGAGEEREEASTRTSTSIGVDVLHAARIPIDLYTPIFAVSRMTGWTAHILEQYANNRLIRPRADYTGPEYPQRFIPLEQR